MNVYVWERTEPVSIGYPEGGLLIIAASMSAARDVLRERIELGHVGAGSGRREPGPRVAAGHDHHPDAIVIKGHFETDDGAYVGSFEKKVDTK